MKKKYETPKTIIVDIGAMGLMYDGMKGVSGETDEFGAKHFEPKGHRKRATTTTLFDDEWDDDCGDDELWGTTFRRYNPWED